MCFHKLIIHTFYRFFISKFYLAVMGTSGLEPPTSRLSGVRSNHLSYAPVQNCFANRRTSAVCSALPKLLASLLWCFSSYPYLIPFFAVLNALGNHSSCLLPLASCFCRGGDEEDRTPDPLLAKQVLSQLSYTPICFKV